MNGIFAVFLVKTDCGSIKQIAQRRYSVQRDGATDTVVFISKPHINLPCAMAAIASDYDVPIADIFYPSSGRRLGYTVTVRMGG